jgi:hypothetical protein
MVEGKDVVTAELSSTGVCGQRQSAQRRRQNGAGGTHSDYRTLFVEKAAA